MPIAHVYMPKNETIMVPLQIGKDPDMLLEHVIGQGALINTYEPQELVNITPRDWLGNEGFVQCLLEMRRSAEAAKLHVMDMGGAASCGFAVSESGKVNLVEGVRTVLIPAMVGAVSLAHKRSESLLEFGGIVTRVTSSFLADNHDHWQVGSSSKA